MQQEEQYKKERKEGLKLLLWVVLAMALHYTALVTGQLLVTSLFAVQDVADGSLAIQMNGEVFYKGESMLESEAGFNRYGYVASGYGTIIAVPIVFLGLFIFSKIRKEPLSKSLPVNRFPVVPSLLSLVIGLAVYFPVSYIVSYTFLNNLSGETEVMLEGIFGATPYWVLFFSMAICAPLIEELTFRGFIYSQMEAMGAQWSARLEQNVAVLKEDLQTQENGSVKLAAVEQKMHKIKRAVPVYVIIGQALLFGAFHMNLQQFIYASALGMLFGLMRHYTKSVWPSVLAHIGFNAFSVGLYGILQHEEWAVTQKLMEISDNTMLLITALIFAVALFLFEIVVKKKDKRPEKTSQNQ